MTEVLLSISDRVAHIRFNRPAQLNAVNVVLAEAFERAVTDALADPSVRCVVISGEGRSFMAGGDLAYFKKSQDRSAAAGALILPIHRALVRLADASQPVIAAVHGPVAGAGMSIALAADLCVAANDVRFNMAYINVAASPDCGGSWALPRLVGLRQAFALTLLSDEVSAQQAFDLGLVNMLVPQDELLETAMAMAARLARGSATAIGATKRLLRHAMAATFDAHLQAEAQSFAALASGHDFGEALDAFFEKRRPVFAGQ